ncbi:MAG: inverse autotransporter beta domain-containing protein, partial [Pseudomonadota bacterium]
MRLRLSVLSSLLLASLSAQADPGRIQVSAMQSNTSIFGADGMLPLLGNNQQFFYGDLMGDYGTDDTYLMSPGLGYRAVVNNQIWGGYVFSDYERTSLGGNFWVISPGVEWMSSNWDAHLNGYFPTQSQQQNGSRAYADTFGIYQYGNPHDYQYDDAYLTPYAVIGNGVDTEVGYSFAQEDHLRSRVSLGGYYYHPQEAYDVSNITGITASFTKSLSKNFSASLLNSYDNFNHYILGVSLTLEFGGDSNEFSTDVSDRLLDPVERHIGIIGTGAGTYDQQNYQVTGYGTEYYPVLYTEPHGTGDGSAKNPAGLTSDNLALFNEMFPGGSMIFVQGGGNANYYLTDPLVINDGQNIYGRTEDYKAPAVRDKQPQIIAASGSDGLDITDATSTISDVSILG